MRGPASSPRRTSSRSSRRSARFPFTEARYKAFTAKRRIVSFGAGYDFDSNRLVEAPPLPAFLMPLRDRVASLSGVPATALSHGLVSEYRPGTALGFTS